MKRRTFLSTAAGFAAGISGIAVTGCSTKKIYDLVITGGTVIDGTGKPGVRADVGVKDGRIALISENIPPAKAVSVIDATGMVVAPGFIDPHTHTDVQLLVNPKAESKIRQGVTTEVGGNCGFSYFPLSDLTFEESKSDLEKEFGIDLDWRDLPGFFTRLGEQGASLNYVTLIGQGNVRSAVIGPYDRPATEDEIAKMRAYIRDGMMAGAWGVSSGLEYTPSGFASTDELVALSEEAAAYGGLYATHMRSEQSYVIEAIEEAVEISERSGAGLQISHLKANYRENWDKMDRILPMITAANDRGIPLKADRYPYEASSTSLGSLFPMWVREGTADDFVKRLADPSLDGKLRESIGEMERRMDSWENILISSVISEKNKRFEGSTVLDAAKESGKDCYTFMRDLLIEEEGSVGMVKFGMSEDNLRRVLAHPLVMVGSDGNAVAPYGELARGKPHPRFYGTFPRVLGRYSREQGVFPLEVAVMKMTSMPADKFGLNGRGRIAVGAWADIVVFDPGTIIDRATYADPHQYPAGISHVIVNGVTVVEGDEHTGALPGVILKKNDT